MQEYQHNSCTIRALLERDYYEAVDRHSAAASLTVDLAGTGKSSAFWKAQSACRGLVTDIKRSRAELAAHRALHGC